MVGQLQVLGVVAENETTCLENALVGKAQDAVFNEMMNGTTAVDTQISTDERRKKTF